MVPGVDGPAGSEVAVLGGGCFWCLEACYQQLRGVSKVVSGYAGGHVDNPTYEQVIGQAHYSGTFQMYAKCMPTPQNNQVGVMLGCCTAQRAVQWYLLTNVCQLALGLVLLHA